jgi:hypothetical protein
MATKKKDPRIIGGTEPVVRLEEEDLLMAKHPAELTNRTVVVVDLGKLDADLSRDKAHYVGPGGEGEIKGRVQGAHEFFERAKKERIPVHMTSVHLAGPKQTSVSISDGRHRLAAMRERGVRVVPVAVNRKEAAEVARRYGADPGEAEAAVTNVTKELGRVAQRKEEARRRAEQKAVEAERREREKRLKPHVQAKQVRAEPPSPAAKPAVEVPSLLSAVKITSAPPPPPAKKPAKKSAKPKKSPAAELAEATILKHLEELDRHVENNGVKGLRKLYAEARGELQHRLKSVAPKDQSVGAVQARAMLKQVDAVAAKLGKGLKGVLKDKGKAAAEMGAKQGVDEYKVLAEQFSGTEPVLKVEAPATMRGLVKGVDSTLLRRHQHRSQVWTLNAVDQMEKSLSISTMVGKSMDDAVDALMGDDGFEGMRWQAERIVRTELAYAHGSAKQRAMEKTAKDTGKKLFKKLIETFDDRTGDDSFLVHGQVVPVDKPFRWKRKLSKANGGGWVAIDYMHPPNRPNDRAVVIPWDPEWSPMPEEEPLTIAELNSARTTRWRNHVGVDIPPGHKPGKP